MKAIKLGQKVRDTITGMEGVVVARTEWLNGCVRLALQPLDLKDGVPQDQYWIDEPQVEVVKDTPTSKVKPSGGPRPDPVRSSDPTR